MAMSAARARNTASTDEIRKLLKAELDGLGCDEVHDHKHGQASG